MGPCTSDVSCTVDEKLVHTCDELLYEIFTVRNEVVKVMFLHMSVCPKWGEYLGRYPLGPGTPPWDQVQPPGPGTPPDQVHPPRTRYTPLGPGTPQDQVHPPRTRYTPQETATVADGMHPTGMHSCQSMQL